MKAQSAIAEGVALSQAEASQAFRGWISAEPLTKRARRLGAESRRQERTKTDLLARALTLWVDRRPEARLTKARLFNEAMPHAVAAIRAAVESARPMWPLAGVKVDRRAVEVVNLGRLAQPSEPARVDLPHLGAAKAAAGPGMKREKYQVGNVPLQLRRTPLMPLGGHDPHLDHAMHERALPFRAVGAVGQRGSVLKAATIVHRFLLEPRKTSCLLRVHPGWR